ncbi:hypothetical protein G7007_02815 [Pseudomonas entomophila]|jgi:hypothetical protein|uniref:hypothetical protein n=1 Tax=Pseudomonas entomophila TaxID=312306 RepID=UPI0015E32460|nr:hypothetical protein [Pseudomonas entomophila]MBA1191795.1 hypothetical protein [Pseudomonas entomophila]
MLAFWNLLTRRPALRAYAYLDVHGNCQAFKHCAERPVGGGWVEITEARLSWLGLPLPASARVPAHSQANGWRRGLPA